MFEGKGQRVYSVDGGILICSAIVCYLCAQSFVDILYMLQMDGILVLQNVLCYLAIVSLLYAVIANAKVTSIIVTILVFVLSTINNYAVAFRGVAFKIEDLYSLQTAWDVRNNYEFYIDRGMVRGFGVLVIWILCLMIVTRRGSGKNSVKWWKRGILFFVALGFVGGICIRCEDIELYEWRNEGVAKNGLVLNLMASNTTYHKPEGYDTFEFEKWEEMSKNPVVKEGKLPNIVVVMNETFSDLRVFQSTLRTSKEVMPYYDSLQKNVIKGYALSSVFGGQTTNCEYEFLTGNSLAFFRNGASAYQRYVTKDSDSLVKVFDKLGYYTIAMHPASKNNWMREKAWKYLGFEECHYIEDFPQRDLIRGYVSDAEVYGEMIDKLQQKKREEPIFLFGVTIQNHGGYVDEEYQGDIRLQGYSKEYPMAEQYLSLLHESDGALQSFLNRISQMEEDTLVVFFGDHQGRLEEDFYEEIYGKSIDSLEEKQKQYLVPYLIWANYEMPQNKCERTSLNYLGNHLMEMAGVELTGYRLFLQQMEQQIPAMNSLGFYSKRTGEFQSYHQAQGEEKELLKQYEILQYHSIFGQ